MSTQKSEVTVGGRTFEVSNLGKVLYPEAGFTKAQVIDYYIHIAPVLLPHLKNRPITLKRYPNGVDGFFFYEKRCPSHRPSWVKTAAVARKHKRDEPIHYCVMNDLAALVWAANLANIELHTFLHRAPAFSRPTAVAFDLDPGPPADIVLCCQVAIWIKELLGRFDLEVFPKTSGSKGLQVYVPLNSPVTYEKAKAFAQAIAIRLEAEHPDVVVSRMAKAARKGKVFIDWSQNDPAKTTINVYSLRAKRRPTVSTPVTWKEVAQCLKKQSSEEMVFICDEVLVRVKRRGDLFETVLTLKQWLPALKAVRSG